MIDYNLLENLLLFLPSYYPMPQLNASSPQVETLNAIRGMAKDMYILNICTINWGYKPDDMPVLPKGIAELKPFTEHLQQTYRGKADIKHLLGDNADAGRLGLLRCSMVNNAYAHLGIIYGLEFLDSLRLWYKKRNDFVRLKHLEQQTELCKAWIANYDLELYGYPFSKPIKQPKKNEP